MKNEGVQEAMCRVAVPAVEWRVQEELKINDPDDTATLTVTIAGAPEEWEEESWRIVGEPQWSEGIKGKILLSDNSVWEDTPLRRKNNQSQITLTQSNLNDPHLCFTVEGPDKVQKPCRVDLTQLCVAKIKGEMIEKERELDTRREDVDAYAERVDKFFIENTQGGYQLPPERASKPRAKKDLTVLLGELESYQRGYEKNL